jgi:hypothetical protein
MVKMPFLAQILAAHCTFISLPFPNSSSIGGSVETFSA